jgi:small ligand-binding sensory domain FIST
MKSTTAVVGVRCAAAISTESNTERAVEDVSRQALTALGARPTLAFVFVSHHHGPSFAPVARRIEATTRTEHLIGCTGEAIVGTGQEIEGRPAVSLWLAHLPGASVRSMRFEFEQTSEGGSFLGWPDDLPEAWPAGSALIVLGEPFSFPVDPFLARMNEDHAGVPVLGGMASGAWRSGENRLLLGGEEFSDGAVAALVGGPVRVRPVVSQGCRPIGQHFVVTKAQQNVILELGGRPALAQLAELFQGLSPHEQSLVQNGLHVGRVTNEYQDQFGRGDFLVRNVIGIDPKSGAVATGDMVRPGQTVQFHIRDAETADDDLNQLVHAAGEQSRGAAAGALLFTCNGRGTRLFGRPHHDAAVIRQHLGDLPTAGFFAQGELGPIGGRNFIHGFTASLVLFEREHHDQAAHT